MKTEERIEIVWEDVVQKLLVDLMAVQHALAIEYAKVEALKRKIAILEADAKATTPTAGQ